MWTINIFSINRIVHKNADKPNLAHTRIAEALTNLASQALDLKSEQLKASYSSSINLKHDVFSFNIPGPYNGSYYVVQ